MLKAVKLPLRVIVGTVTVPTRALERLVAPETRERLPESEPALAFPEMRM